MVQLGIFAWFSYPLPIEERLQMIKQAGFGAVSLWWGGTDEAEKHRQPELTRRLGLEIDNVHAPYGNTNALWEDGLEGEAYLQTLCSCLSDCSRHGIPTAVVHITRLSTRPAFTQTGMDRIKRLVEHAERVQVNLAIENLNSIPHLDRIYAKIPSGRLGFCYDSGHENFNHPDADCLSRYGDRLFAVHLHDNCGDADAHLLPYDGNIDWDSIKGKLKKARTIPYLTLEVDFKREHPQSWRYQSLSAEAFLALAYARLQRLV